MGHSAQRTHNQNNPKGRAVSPSLLILLNKRGFRLIVINLFIRYILELITSIQCVKGNKHIKVNKSLALTGMTQIILWAR